MTMFMNLKARIRESKPLLGTLISLPSPEIAEVCINAGFGWLLIDMEHGLLTYADAQRIVQVAGNACPCLIRVAANDTVSISKALDTGAAGIIFPHINGTDEAREAIRASKYPPQGKRSLGIARAQGYGAWIKESLEHANQDSVLIAQVEHIQAARSIEAILSVTGLDGVFIGPFDLSASLNKPGLIHDPEVQGAIKMIRDACVIAQLPVGILARSPDAARTFMREGYRLICLGSETMLLGDFLRQVVESVKYG